jgi:AraC-like DNA-binding protein
MGTRPTSTDRPTSTYRELPPPPELAAYVDCLWVQQIGDGDVPYEQPVLPDGAMDIVALRGGLVVSGADTRPEVLTVPPRSTTVGVRFRPGAAVPLLGTSAADLRDTDVPLDALWGRLGTRLAEQVAEGGAADGWRAQLGVLVDALAERRRDAPDVDPAATGVAALLARQPAVPLPRLADRAGLSERQLRRRVEEAVGYPPRTLARILRFQRFLRAWRAAPPGRRELAILAAETGYADQAHLTREFRRLAGLPPKALLSWEADRLSQRDAQEPSDRGQLAYSKG